MLLSAGCPAFTLVVVITRKVITFLAQWSLTLLPLQSLDVTLNRCHVTSVDYAKGCANSAWGVLNRGVLIQPVDNSAKLKAMPVDNSARLKLGYS